MIGYEVFFSSFDFFAYWYSVSGVLLHFFDFVVKLLLGRPAITCALPLDPYFLLSDAVACTPMRFPQRLLPLLRLVLPLGWVPKVCRADAKMVVPTFHEVLSEIFRFLVPAGDHSTPIYSLRYQLI